jgi:hypothetical protein
MFSSRIPTAIPGITFVFCGLIVLLVDGQANTPVALADDAGDSKVKVVEVSGAGTDVESAKKDACREAVRQVVGAYVNSQTRTENDDLIEDKVISLSSGFVEKIEALKESQSDGLIRVRIRATVRISKVLDSLKANRISVVDVDGASLGAELLGKNDQRKGESELITAAFEGFPTKWFKATVAGKPRLGERGAGADVQLIVTLAVEPDLDGFIASATKLDEALKATGRHHGKFEMDATTLGPGMTPASSQDSATGFLRNLFADSSGPGGESKVAAVYFIDGRSAFPELLRDYPTSSISGQLLMPPGLIPVTFPVKFRGNGRQATWHWYGLKVPEALKYIAPLFRKPLTLRTALMDDNGEEIAINTCEIPFMGVGGMKYWEEWQATDSSKQAAVAIAPAAIIGIYLSVDWLIPKFTCERTITLAEEEVRRLVKVAISLE